MSLELNIWKESYPVRFYYVKDSKTVCPTMLCDFMQDSAVNHIEALGHSLELLQKENRGWFLSKMHIELNELPEWRDSVHIETWQPGIDKLYAIRDFILTNNSGREIGRATSFWLAVDVNKNRIVRPENYLKDSVFIKDYRAIDRRPGKVASVTEFDYTDDFIVHENNLDLNGHTNSIIYLKWIAKLLKTYIPDGYKITDVEVNYNAQSFPGDKIKLFTKVDHLEADNSILTHHSLVKESNGDNICNVKIIHNK